MKTEDLRGVFGMLEMEAAAAVIANLGRERPVYLDVFSAETERTGFLNLIAGGFLVRGNYNSEFIGSDEFWKRITKATWRRNQTSP